MRLHNKYIVITFTLGCCLFGVSQAHAQVGADGASFTSRQQQWLSSEGRGPDGDFNNITQDGKSHLFAWFENGLYFGTTGPSDDPYAGSAHDEIQSLLGSDWNYSGSQAQVTGMRLFLQYPDVLQGTRAVNGNTYQFPGDYTDIDNTMNGQVRQYHGLTARLGGAGQSCSAQPMRSVTSYLYTLTDAGATFTYPSDQPTWTGPGSGTVYQPGNTYNSHTYTLDLLYNGFENCYTTNTNYEMDGGNYTWRTVISFLLLYDFADRTCTSASDSSALCVEGREMKKRAKMTIDTIVLDEMMDFSAQHHGGMVGRKYRRDMLDRVMHYGLHYPYFGYDEKASRDTHGHAYVSTYRPSQLIHDLALKLEFAGTGDWHWHQENGNIANLDGTTGKWNFLTPNFNIGGGESATPNWHVNIRQADNSLNFWVDQNSWSGHRCTNSWAAPCNREPRVSIGTADFKQFRNSLLFSNSGKQRFHIQMDGSLDDGQSQLNSLAVSETETDPELCNGGVCTNNYQIPTSWTFFREGNVAFAMMRNGSIVGIELAQLGGTCDYCYPDYTAFQNAVIANAAVFSNAFIDSRGNQLNRSDSISCGLNSPGDCAYPFSRISTIGQGNNNLITWNSNIMTLTYNGRQCAYNFNNWTYSGADCEGPDGSIIAPPPTTPPTTPPAAPPTPPTTPPTTPPGPPAGPAPSGPCASQGGVLGVGGDHIPDLTSDGCVNGSDLSVLLGQWGDTYIPGSGD